MNKIILPNHLRSSIYMVYTLWAVMGLFTLGLYTNMAQLQDSRLKAPLLLLFCYYCLMSIYYTWNTYRRIREYKADLRNEQLLAVWEGEESERIAREYREEQAWIDMKEREMTGEPEPGTIDLRKPRFNLSKNDGKMDNEIYPDPTWPDM